MQLTFVMRGGLGFAVSVLTFLACDNEPSLFAVNANTESSYLVAGSGVKQGVNVSVISLSLSTY